MRAATKASLGAFALLWSANVAYAQDASATFQGTLKARALALSQLLIGRYANAEQSAFAAALTPPGAEVFETEYQLIISKTDEALSIKANDMDFLPDATAEISVTDAAVTLTISSEDSVCVGSAEPLLSGFQIVFKRPSKRCTLGKKMTVLPSGIHLENQGKRPALQLRRANDFTCWTAIPRRDESWFFKADIPVHDQGGWAWVETDETPPQRIGFRMRQAVWPYGTSRPSLVLYVHKDGEEDRAASYAWADPDAKRVGLNLRWVQGSCSKVGAE